MSLTLEAGSVGLSQVSRGIEMFNVGVSHRRNYESHTQYVRSCLRVAPATSQS